MAVNGSTIPRQDGRDTSAPDTPEYDWATGRAPMLLVAAALAGGIVLDRLLGQSVLAQATLDMVAEGWWLLAIGAWGVWLLLWRRERDTAAAVALVVSIVASGAAWHDLRFDRFADDNLGWYAQARSAPACIEATVREPPRRLPAGPFDPMSPIPKVDRTLLSVAVSRLRDGTQMMPTSGLATVIIDGHLLGVHPGDRLRIFGSLQAPSPARNPGGFDAAQYARGERKLATVRCSFPDCLTTLSVEHWGPSRLIDRIRQSAQSDFRRYLGERHATLAGALVLGRRDALDDETLDAFRGTGTLHLLAISGMHVGMLAGAWFLVLRGGWLPRGLALSSVVVFTIAYAALTGANPPVIRAAVMITMLCGALLLGRRRIGWNVLAAAVVLLLVLSPADLFNTGPQLSVLASAVIFGVAPLIAIRRPADPLDRLIANTRPWHIRAIRWCLRHYWQLTCLSFAIWIITLPLIMARFHTLAPLALVLNPLLVLPVMAALLSGFVVMVTGSLLPPLAALAGGVCGVSLDVLAWAVETGYEQSGRTTWTAGPADWWLVGFYTALATLALAVRRWHVPRRWIAAGLSFWVLVGVTPSLARTLWPAQRLEVCSLSVGRGLATVLHLPDGKTMVYDAGHLGPPDSAARTVADYLWDRGITHLDAVVISHPDVDHFNGVAGLVDRFSIGAVYVSPMFDENDSGSVRALRRCLEDAGIEVDVISAGDRLGSGEYRIDVLFPTVLGVLGDDNANSLVLAVEYAGRRVLLTGDLESPGIEAVLAEAPYDCDVLQVPHHGSAGSMPKALARWCTPEVAIISGSFGQSPESVSRVYTAAGAKVMHTAHDGAIRVLIDRNQWRVERFITEP